MILLPKPPKIISKKDDWAVFEIEALYPGYGVTIGNSLRRTLLSSLSGAAATHMKIKGVQHEFSPVKGVLEDAMTIGMNLKHLRFKMLVSEPQKAVLKVRGEKEARGADFDMPSQVELINKDLHIADVTDKNTELEIEIQIEQGLGYESVENRKKQGKLEIGVIPLEVDNMRVGDRTDFDRLQIEITTDGTISPEDAFKQAATTLVDHFSLIAGKTEEIKKEEEPKEEDALKNKVEEMDISARTQNVLIENNIKTLGGLLRKSESSLTELEGMGDKSMEEIKKALKKLGLELKS